MSDWVEALQRACEKPSSQAAVARRLNLSASTVNQVLKGVYKGNLANIETTVRGALMGETVECPVVGELTKAKCQANQKLPFAATNPERVKLWRACRDGCPHSRIRK